MTMKLSVRPRAVYFMKNNNFIYVQIDAVNRVPNHGRIGLDFTSVIVSGNITRVTKSGVVLSEWTIERCDVDKQRGVI